MDPGSFRARFPALCDDARLLALGARGPAEGAHELLPAALESFSVAGAKDPDALSEMLETGPEAVAWYVSFRLEPERWGVYLQEGGVQALKEEYHRIIWRDLGKYADKPIDNAADRIEYALVLDYLLAHSRFHYLVDHAAAQRELIDGKPRFIPYLEWRAATAQRPRVPDDILDLEEALANLEAFRPFIDPAYCSAIPRPVEGRIDLRNYQQWLAFFVGGRWGTEIANALTRQPSGFRDFTRFLNRTASVGAYNYVRVRYSYNKESHERALKMLSARIDGREPPADLSDSPDYFGIEAPPVRVFLAP